MTRREIILLAAAGATAMVAAGPAGAGEGEAGWKSGTPGQEDIKRQNFKDKKTVKTLSAVWDRLGHEGYHGFHDVRRGDGWISCLAWKDGELYKIRVDSETGSIISTRRVQ